MENKLIVKLIQKFATPINSMLRGNIKSEVDAYVALSTTYNEKGLQLSETKFFEDGSIEEQHAFTYSDEGFLILHHVAIPDDNIEESFITNRNGEGLPLEIIKMYGEEPGERTTYEYGANKQPILITQYDADGELESTEKIEYNADNKLISRVVEAPNSDPSYRKVIFSYTSEGLLEKAEEFDANDKLLGSHVYSYDADGREIRLQQFNDLNKLTVDVTSEYDQDGLLIRKVSSGFYTRISNYNYDEAGRLIEESYSDENGFVISRSSYEFNEDGSLGSETVYETDLTRGGRDTHISYSYEYEYHA
jgi:hypothetical protein